MPSPRLLRAAALAAALLPVLCAAAPLTLDQALELAVQRSESARAARAGATSATEAARAAGQLPDPVLRAGVDNLPISGADRFSSRDSMTMKRVGISQSYMQTALQGNRWFAMVYRMHDMTPSSGNNLEALRKQFGRIGSVQLIPGQFNRAALGFEMTQENFALGIQLSQLKFVQAWQVGGDSPLLTATRGITDPVLPPGVAKAHFVEALQRLKARSTGAPGQPH